MTITTLRSASSDAEMDHCGRPLTMDNTTKGPISETGITLENVIY